MATSDPRDDSALQYAIEELENLVVDNGLARSEIMALLEVMKRGRVEVSPLSCKAGRGLGCGWHLRDLGILEGDDLPLVLFLYDDQCGTGFYFGAYGCGPGPPRTYGAWCARARWR